MKPEALVISLIFAVIFWIYAFYGIYAAIRWIE
jgi:hypothetical protein